MTISITSKCFSCPLLSLPLTFSHTQAATDLFSDIMDMLAFSVVLNYRIIQCVLLFFTLLLSLSIVIVWFIHVAAWISNSLHFTPVYFQHRHGCATMNVLAPVEEHLSFWLLQSILLWTFIYKPLYRPGVGNHFCIKGHLDIYNIWGAMQNYQLKK